MTRYATEAPSGVLVISDVPLEAPGSFVARLFRTLRYYAHKHGARY